MKSALLNTTLALFLVTAATAWSINGHLYLANIAQNRLIEYNPDSFQYALTMLQYLHDADPELTYEDGDNPFVECSTFADDIKYNGGAWQSDFHFIKLPNVVDQGIYPIDQRDRNLTYGIIDLIQWLSLEDDGLDYESSYIYDYIQNRLYPGQPDLAQSYALRLLIHYMGDIHQPLHCETLYSQEFPDGDKGGNLFMLPYHYGVDELHALWDQIMYSGYHNIARPISPTYWPTFQANTLQIAANSSAAVADPTEWQSLDVEKWAQESYEIAKNSVYTGVTENEPVPSEYITDQLIQAQDRITLGGYRLAYVVAYMFPANLVQPYIV